MRSRPGRGQSFKAEAKSLRPKPIFWPRVYFAIEDLTSLGNNFQFKIIAGKINKIPEIYTILPENAQLYNKTRSRPGRGQMFEAKAKIFGLESTLASKT